MKNKILCFYVGIISLNTIVNIYFNLWYLTIEIKKLENEKNSSIGKSDANRNPLYIVLSLLLESFPYNKILDSIIKKKKEKNYSKLDKVIRNIIETEGYSNFVKELIKVKNELDKKKLIINEKSKKLKNLKKESNKSNNIYMKFNQNKKKFKEEINKENKEDSSFSSNNNENDKSNSSKEIKFRKKNMYSLRNTTNYNKKLYLDLISNSSSSSSMYFNKNNIDDFDISLDEEEKKNENETENQKKEIIDLSEESDYNNESKIFNSKEKDKNYDIEIELGNIIDEKNSYSRQKYYQKGGKYGMHYYLSEKDNRIYKYYSVQYNGDKSIGFRCTDTSCKSRAILYPKNKEFKIISRHSLKFEEHKKLQGSMKSDRFIKAMLNNNLKEIQLTKKDNIKSILWFK